MTTVCLLIAAVISAAPAEGLPAAPVTAIAFAPEGNSVVVATTHEVAELSWPQLKLLRKLSVELAHFHDAAFAPGGQILAIAGGKPAESGGLVLLSWPDIEPRREFEVGDDVIHRAVWYPEGNKMALACADHTVPIVSRTGRQAVRLDEHSAPVLAALFVPDILRPLLVTAGRDQTIRIWNADRPAKSVRSLDNHTAAVVDLALRPLRDDEPPMIASAGADRTIRFWQPAIGRLVRFSRLPSPPLAICWTADGQRIAAACQDGNLRIVELQSAVILSEHAAVEGWAYSVALASDGKSLLVGGEAGQLAVVTITANR
jgi:WD40 repeat protein